MILKVLEDIFRIFDTVRSNKVRIVELRKIFTTGCCSRFTKLLIFTDMLNKILEKSIVSFESYATKHFEPHNCEDYSCSCVSHHREKGHYLTNFSTCDLTEDIHNICHFCEDNIKYNKSVDESLELFKECRTSTIIELDAFTIHHSIILLMHVEYRDQNILKIRYNILLNVVVNYIKSFFPGIIMRINADYSWKNIGKTLDNTIDNAIEVTL
jgi:hypothetical protein